MAAKICFAFHSYIKPHKLDGPYVLYIKSIKIMFLKIVGHPGFKKRKHACTICGVPDFICSLHQGQVLEIRESFFVAFFYVTKSWQESALLGLVCLGLS
jgi:hypothetical protein